jgi:hypothetical protein
MPAWSGLQPFFEPRSMGTFVKATPKTDSEAITLFYQGNMIVVYLQITTWLRVEIIIAIA